MRLLPLVLLFPLTLTGCYFSYVEGQDDWDDDDWSSWDDTGDVSDDTDTTGGDDPIVDYADAFGFDPEYLIIGEMQVLDVFGDPDVCAAVVSIDLGLDADVHAIDTVDDEIRIALTVSETAAPGTTDVTIVMDDGTTVVLADALDVLTPEEAADQAWGECD